MNLLSNAYKFTPSGGEVRVSVRETRREGDSGLYELHVADTGIGMAPEFAENMFTPFERERTSTVSGIQGTGLGLSICKAIADACHGELGVESEGEGHGSTFWIRIPCEKR
jgi:signal transduction histidine kinase